MEHKFEFGEGVKDVVTGFKGVVLARYEYATGCTHYDVCSGKLDKEGAPQKWHTFDESRLVKHGKGIKLPSAVKPDVKPKRLAHGGPSLGY